MANYSIGTIKCNKQSAMAYIVFMIVGSYFEDARMVSQILEKRMMIEYTMLNRKEQESREEKVDRVIRLLGEGFLTKVCNIGCKVHARVISTEKGENIICLWFETGVEELIVMIDKKGEFFVERHKPLTGKKWLELKVERVKKKNSQKGNEMKGYR